ncbi:hypothetical protein STRUR_1038 [Streptococcus urinalis 2285-97]|uniref:ABC transmembrane type-1 domain-containing protein n=2 Tax=Streptococcus urinalis TaxID=149016 RepID=G5KFN1_9STRE|nr:hypothetical protein STRUR_1038 [Streptococcus urinalis 2285-97]
MISEDIEAMEIFFAHTLAPICTAFLSALLIFLYFGQFSLLLSFISLSSYFVIAFLIPALMLNV